MKSYKEVYKMINGLQKKAADQTKPIKAPQNKGYIEQITGGSIPLTSDGTTLQGNVPLKDARQAQAKQVSGIYPTKRYVSPSSLRLKRRAATDTLRDFGKFKQSLNPQELNRLQQALRHKDFYILKRMLQRKGQAQLYRDGIRDMLLDTERNRKANDQLWFKLKNQVNTNNIKKLPIA